MVSIGMGNPIGATVQGTEIVIGSDARGDILFRDATKWARLAAGTSGNFLKTNGAGADPAWAGAGSWTLIETKTLAAAATTTFTIATAGKFFALVYNVRTGVQGTADQLAIVLNADTGNNYDYIRFNGAALSAAASTGMYRLNIGNGTSTCGIVFIGGEARSDGLSNAFIGLSSLMGQHPNATHEAAICGNWDTAGTANVDLTSITFRNDNANATITGTVSLFEMKSA